MQVNVKWICELGTHYNDSLFNSLNTNDKINLEVFYILEKLESHPWKKNKRIYNFKYYKKVFFIDWRLLRNGITKRRTVWIIGGWFDLTSLLILLFRSFCKWNYIIWTDTPDTRERPKTIFNLIRNIVLKHILNNATYVMGTGKHSIPILQKLGARGNKIVNMPYFVDTFLFNPLSESNFFANGPTVFLSAGRLINKIKGFDLALSSLAKIKLKYPDFKFQYKIAGIGDDLYSLNKLVVELDLINEVEFVGWLEANELPNFLQLGHYFLHPARYEPYGVSILEAMAAGLIVIGSDSTGAVLDRIIADYNGFIHSSGSSQSLYEQIEKTIILPRGTKVSMRKNSYNLALEWDVKKGHDIIIKLIEEICVV
jgi:glycosyltransferase involved in cell wall biosynthesis